MTAWMRQRPVTSAIVLVLGLAAAGIGVWRALDGSKRMDSAEARAIRTDLASMVAQAAELARLTGPDLDQIRHVDAGEDAWRQKVIEQIELLREHVERVKAHPGATLLSERTGFMLHRTATRLDKFRADIRRRVTTIEQSACSIARQGTREIAALDGNLPDQCIGVRRTDCSEIIRAYMTHLDVVDNVCRE